MVDFGVVGWVFYFVVLGDVVVVVVVVVFVVGFVVFLFVSY